MLTTRKLTNLKRLFLKLLISFKRQKYTSDTEVSEHAQNYWLNQIEVTVSGRTFLQVPPKFGRYHFALKEGFTAIIIETPAYNELINCVADADQWTAAGYEKKIFENSVIIKN